MRSEVVSLILLLLESFELVVILVSATQIFAVVMVQLVPAWFRLLIQNAVLVGVHYY